MLEQQKNVCKICHKPENAILRKKTKRLAVDHCHKSELKGINKIRGLLCQKCNQILGLALESSKTLRNAADYLDLHND